MKAHLADTKAPHGCVCACVCVFIFAAERCCCFSVAEVNPLGCKRSSPRLNPPHTACVCSAERPNRQGSFVLIVDFVLKGVL